MLVIGALAGILTAPRAVLLGPFVLSVAMGAWIGATIMILIELSSFWLESERGVRYLVIGATTLPSGLLLPADFFPDWVQTLFLATPFPYSLYVPASLWVGRTPVEAVPRLLFMQAVWVVALTLAARAMLRAGSRRLQIQGG